MKIVLIGMRGSGKSTVGPLLAARLDMPLLSIDERIESKAGSTIAALVEAKGWRAFRDLESRIIMESAGLDNIVIDCGGGAVLRQKNLHLLKQNGIVVWLHAEPDVLLERMRTSAIRPPLVGRTLAQEIERTWKQRRDLYAAAKDLAVDSSRLSAVETTEQILSFLEK
jgi:shikimate kinase